MGLCGYIGGILEHCPSPWHGCSSEPEKRCADVWLRTVGRPGERLRTVDEAMSGEDRLLEPGDS